MVPDFASDFWMNGTRAGTAVALLILLLLYLVLLDSWVLLHVVVVAPKEAATGSAFGREEDAREQRRL